MPDWIDLAFDLATALNETRQELGAEAPEDVQAILLDSEQTVRNVAQHYASGHYVTNVYSEVPLIMRRELEDVTGLPAQRRVKPLLQFTSNFLSAGPHGSGKPPRY